MSSWQCGDVWAPKVVSLFSASIISLISVVVTIGNILVLLVIYKDPLNKLKTPFTYFIVNLAFADLLVGVVTCPVYVYTLVLESTGELSETMAKTYHMAFFISATASILSLVALSIDRYVTIAFPLKYKYYFSNKRCRGITAVIWFVAVSSSCMYMQVGYIDYLMIFANAAIIVALFIFICTYYRVYKFLHDQTTLYRNKIVVTTKQEQMERMDNDRKITRLFLSVLLVFICTYCPATVMIYFLQYCPSCDCTVRHWMRDLVILFIIINSCINPFVYTIKFKAFRTALSLVVSRDKDKIRRERYASTISMLDVKSTVNRTESFVVPRKNTENSLVYV